MTKIITFGLGLALAFAEVGKLKEATYKMAVMAAEAQQHEMISLGIKPYFKWRSASKKAPS